MEGKGKAIAEFNNDEEMCEFAFLVDVTTHFNELNTRLQCRDRWINSMLDSFKAFEIKLVF